MNQNELSPYEKAMLFLGERTCKRYGGEPAWMIVTKVGDSKEKPDKEPGKSA